MFDMRLKRNQFNSLFNLYSSADCSDDTIVGTADDTIGTMCERMILRRIHPRTTNSAINSVSGRKILADKFWRRSHSLLSFPNSAPRTAAQVRVEPCISELARVGSVELRILFLFFSELARGLREVCEKADDDLAQNVFSPLFGNTRFLASRWPQPFRKVPHRRLRASGLTAPRPSSTPRSFPFLSPFLQHSPSSCAPRFFLLPPCLVLFGGNL
jgi:hypothetical protein